MSKPIKLPNEEQLAFLNYLTREANNQRKDWPKP